MFNAESAKYVYICIHKIPRNSACTDSPEVRCDGTVPTCRTCERLSFQCSFEQDGTSGNYAPPKIPPKCRGAKACLECRSMKVRCSGEGPKCTNCRRRNKQCTYSSSSSSSSSSTARSGQKKGLESVDSSSQATTSPEEHRSSNASALQQDSPESMSSYPTADSPSSSPSDEVLHTLVEQYFDRLYPLASFNFLHRVAAIQRCHDGTLERTLKLALCAITAIYFKTHPDDRDNWAQEAEQLILDRLERPSIFQLQASLLLIRYRAAVGQFPRAFIMAGLAARWAVALRLNYEHSKLSLVAQEVRRRTFWSLYLLEDSFCVGLKEFELFDSDIIHLQLPCPDEDFYQERLTSTGYLQPGRGLEPETLEARAAFVRVTFVRRAVMRLNRRVALKEVSLSELFSSMERLQNDLLRLREKLAPCDQHPPGSYVEYHQSPRSTIVVCPHP